MYLIMAELVEASQYTVGEPPPKFYELYLEGFQDLRSEYSPLPLLPTRSCLVGCSWFPPAQRDVKRGALLATASQRGTRG